MKIVTNYLGRTIPLTISILLICIGFYHLPETLFGYSIKNVDLLSEIRIQTESTVLDSLREQLNKIDTIAIDSIEVQPTINQKDSVEEAQLQLAVRDSLLHRLGTIQGADSTGKHIEDYSTGHIALHNFFKAIKEMKNSNKPVRIAFLGDSFIEGDIMVADFRYLLQKKFGGKGVGFIPIDAVAAEYRPTIEVKSKGWKTHSILTENNQRFTLSGLLFNNDSLAKKTSISLKTTQYRPLLDSISSLKLIYQNNKETRIKLIVNNATDSLTIKLPETKNITQYEYNGSITDAQFEFENLQDFKAIGLALEENQGIIVDNHSLRGNTGLVMQNIDSTLSCEFDKIRHYDLIILQYGLNVASEEVLQYDWYTKSMIKVINKLKLCYPNTDILLMGVSDRGTQTEGEIKTMPAVLALLYAQRQTARLSKIAFWNTFGAMGGENSIIEYVDKNWAAKDFTHLSFRGGRALAEKLTEALLKEMELYEKLEKNNVE